MSLLFMCDTCGGTVKTTAQLEPSLVPMPEGWAMLSITVQGGSGKQIRHQCKACLANWREPQPTMKALKP